MRQNFIEVLRSSAGPDAGEKTEDAGRNRPGQQDGAGNLGNVDEGRRLQRSGTDCGGMIVAATITGKAV